MRLSPDGFLDGPTTSPSADNIVTLESISQYRLLVLRGEPFTGKSTALADEYARVRRNLEPGDVARMIDLRNVPSSEELRRELEAPDLQEWSTGSGTLHLFIDSLDEALRLSRPIGRFLIDQLSRLDTSRLRLRLVCRTADWPPSLEEMLVDRWEQKPVFELQPLCRRDIELAAGEEGFDPAAFMAEVNRRGVGGLAAKPGTLLMLLDRYRAAGNLQVSRAELYLDACLRLASVSEGYAGPAGVDPLGAPEIMAIAERVAAVTMICAKETICDRAGDLSGPTALRSRELWGGSESWHLAPNAPEVSVSVTETGINAALRTALFSGSGASSLTWGHHTYAEFLAARYLTHKRPDAAISLITMPFLDGLQLIPELKDLAAWFADVRPEMWQELLALDPVALLRSDLRSISDEQREDLVDALLGIADQRRLLELIALDLQALRHPRIASQLRSAITNQDLSTRRRQLAIELATDTAVDELGPTIVELALDVTELYYLRVSAARAASTSGDTDVLRNLRRLLDAPTGTDPDDELKGYALRALWPSTLTIEEVLQYLSAPQQDYHFGSYWMFLNRHFASGLRCDDLPTALIWAGEIKKSRPRHSLDKLHDDIIAAGIASIQEPGVATALARAVLTTIGENLTLFFETSSGARPLFTSAVRRTVVDHSIPYVVSGEVNPRTFAISSPPLLVSDDIPWLLTRLSGAQEPGQRMAWAKLAETTFRGDDSDHVAEVLEAASVFPELAETLRPWLEAVELGSSAAVRSRKIYEMSLARQEDSGEPVDVREVIEQRVLSALDEIESGNARAWLDLTLAMTRATGREMLLSDCRESPIWADGEPALRLRILLAAARFLSRSDPDSARWYRSNQIPCVAIGGYQAMIILEGEAPAELDRLDPAVWSRWIDTLVTLSNVAGEDSVTISSLRERAYSHVPSQLVSSVMEKAEYEAGQGHSPSSLRQLEPLWDGQIAQALLETAASAASFKLSASALEMLLEHDVPAAEDEARQSVPNVPPTEARARERAVSFAALLMLKTQRGFDYVWGAGEQDDAFLREVLVEIATRHERFGGALSLRLNERQLGSLYLWLATRYPYTEDERLRWCSGDMPDSAMRTLRDSLLASLADRNSRDAVLELQHLTQQAPNLDFLKVVANETADRWASNAWIPLSPSELILFSADAELRLVESGEALVRVLIESLERAEKYLHGENRAMAELWNTNPAFRPKAEPELSDWLSRHFKRDLVDRMIVVNREVEVSRRTDAGLGDRTDIHVTGWSKQPPRSSPVTVVVEVKGNWNAELLIGLPEQLVARYMAPVGVGCGIYLVGWFASDKWDSDDGRCHVARRREVNEVLDMLETQAEQCSSDNGILVRAVSIDLTLE